jgi:hypothetical protein
MRARAYLAGLLACCAGGGAHTNAATSAAPIQAQSQAQAQAFRDGKAYKPANAGIKAGIDERALAEVPGQDATTTNDLKRMYGSNLNAPGQSKVAACASQTPGTDAYKNQECDTINYVVGNPSARPAYTIDKVNDPVVVRGNNVRNTPEANTSGATGLSGNYTACVDQTTNQPERFDTERCQVGRPVTEAICNSVLNVSYSWQRYANQPGADLRYARCAAGQIRGDQLTIPYANAYRGELAACADRSHGAGTETLIWYADCAGNTALHGYDASGCSIPPDPAVSDPPRQAIASCANAPRNNENCFTPAGQYTDKVEAPVFEDHWDDSACADLRAHGADIRN